MESLLQTNQNLFVIGFCYLSWISFFFLDYFISFFYFIDNY